MEKHLTHTDGQGKARMVDVGEKAPQKRMAEASGMIRMSRETLRAIRENLVQKGDVLTVAQIAGIQAAKATSSLIPLCHSLTLDHVSLDFELEEAGVSARCRVRSQGRTGVEMEALSGVTVALLTIYDMCKAIDKALVLDGIRLVKKEKEDIT
ncbi:MAG: cyclic pyranopterin monophosphate synthase MoaC [Bacteroidia bacterium]|nr:MAG: cyclic pyranopterin monophosphate synthase MoaC [Bacteroidia bacterium]